ncbi:MAG: hypothetical protein OEQ81_10840 [Flavobacteriaceae bacterium]|nr:hypothetical protein [Flavobacteriaceae bacterium]
MLKRRIDYSKISNFTIGNNISLYSLDSFRNNLEMEYFAEVNIANIDGDDKGSDLVIEFQSNFSLVEFLNQIKKRNIGQVNRMSIDDYQDMTFTNSLEQLRAQNIRPIGLEELNFCFSDCEITIKMIYPNSIEDQLGNIFRKLERHYKHFASSNSGQPAEIFIPVFEENLADNLDQACFTKDGPSSKKDYFNFWGIYFSHNDDAVIYDLKTRSIISGDLYMLS